MFRLVTSSILLVGILYLGSAGVGPVPGLGPLLDPASGIWSAARGAEPPKAAQGTIPGLDASTRVVYDDRAVPHVFASTRLDAIRALGYVVARDRLFQLELQVRVAEGSLTELVGAAALAMDRGQRRRGLAWSAEQAWAALEEGSDVRRAFLAYADGVNAWIEHMRPQDRPLEYDLLGARPRPWLPQYPLYVHRQLGRTLGYGELGIPRADLAALVGWEAAEALIPVAHPIQEPLVPDGGTGPRFDRDPLPPPGAPASGLERMGSLGMRGSSSALGLGSNAWAAGPTKTASGGTLLAGDPHLAFSLPSPVYEVHLVVPGEMDVYGATFPGLPGVILGFNRDVAWSFTNALADGFDLYAESVDDPDAPTQYLLDGAWRPLERRAEEYRDGSGRLLRVDTLLHTHRGPLLDSLAGSVIVDFGRHFSLRWTVLEDRGETLAALLNAQTATSVEEWLEALPSSFAPTQNGLVAGSSTGAGAPAIGSATCR
jgi:penicillin amidase